MAMLEAEHSVYEAIETVTHAIQTAIDAGQTDAIIVLVQPGMQQAEGDATRLAQAIRQVAVDSTVTVVASFTAVLESSFTHTAVVGGEIGRASCRERV